MLRAPKAPGARQDGSRRAPRQASIPAKRLGRSSSRLDAAPDGVVDLKYRFCSTTRLRVDRRRIEKNCAPGRILHFVQQRPRSAASTRRVTRPPDTSRASVTRSRPSTSRYAGPTAICDSAVSPPARVPTNSARRGQSRSTRPKMRATTTTKVIEVDRERRTRPPGPTPGPPPTCRRRPSRPRRGICSMAWR